jgi:ATP-dependent Clp protease ATP-binding subunit ClpA/ATP-dependent Clp protease ATP-binding subunit ClpC
VHFTIPLFERRAAGRFSCATLGLGSRSQQKDGKSLHKVHRAIEDALRAAIGKARAEDLRRFQMARGISLARVRLELTLAGEGGRRKATGMFPIVVEPRWASERERVHVAYHPHRQGDAVPVDPMLPLGDQLRPVLSRAWAELDDGEIGALVCDGRERIDLLSFSCDTRSLLEDLPPKDDAAGDRDAGARRRGLRLIPRLAQNLSELASRGDLEIGAPRSPYRERLGLLLGAGRSRPTVVVGPPGCGKTTLIHRAVADLLEIDGYPAHRNLDRVRPAFRLSGRRIIAGMSRLGEWEQRAVDVIEEARARGVILVVDDLAHFGSIGRSRESDRSLADVFRGPLSRREIVVVGECTEEELRRLTEEAPAFASLFAPLHVAPATSEETLRLLVREMRGLERRHKVEVSPHALRAILDVGGSLLSSRAFPGKAVDLLRELAEARSSTRDLAVEPGHLLELLSKKTGVPEVLLRGEARLDPADVEAALARHVMGQDEAVRVAASLVCRVKAGLVDPRRPYGVFLFTGPTGTGKTELAKCLAEYLYGSPSRMLRFDMSELAGPDAPARLAGDRWRPEGLLTQRVLEQPFSLVLLDEIEKAHPSVLYLLLQLFEDGRLTDAAGRTAHFQHAVVIMTSNLGARPRPAVGFGETPEAVLQDVARAVREFFPPELFNRIDRVVPFRPLTPEIAARVAGKELDRLTRRRGLAERSIFVDVGPGVAEQVAREAFVMRDGARSVKRFLEDRIGSRLAAAITEGAPAAMQILRIRADADGFGVTREALVEASPTSARFGLAPLLDLPFARLKERLPALLDFVDTLDHDGEIERLSERIRFHLAQQGERDHAEAVYNLDAMRDALHAFRARVEDLRRRDDGDEQEMHEWIEADRFRWIRRNERDGLTEQRYRLFHRSQMPAAAPRLARDEVLACLAEGWALRRAVRAIDDPARHAIFVDVSRAADLGDPGRFDGERWSLVDMLSYAYAGAEGHVSGTARAGPTRVVMKIVGPCVRDFFELEAGAHVWTSLARGPEVVRVVVSSARPGEEAADAAARPTDEAMPPVVRKTRVDPGGLVPFEIEDYVMAYAATVHARSLAGALAPLWLLRASREDEP